MSSCRACKLAAEGGLDELGLWRSIRDSILTPVGTRSDDRGVCRYAELREGGAEAADVDVDTGADGVVARDKDRLSRLRDLAALGPFDACDDGISLFLWTRWSLEVGPTNLMQNDYGTADGPRERN